jgi:hypothetical protein
MARLRRPLTDAERTQECPRCGAPPARRCLNPNGTVYAHSPHTVREEVAPGGKFSPENIHPRTLAQVGIGTVVVVRDAYGKFLERTAMTGVVRGHDFLVIWVTRPEEINAARCEGRDPDRMPWPAGDVWLPGDEPREDEESAS